MKLVQRVSLFFLTALGVILAVYSFIVYTFVGGQLQQQFDQELHAELNALVAAVEVEPEEVKWQRLEHTIELVSGPDEIRWVVLGDRERIVDQSREATPELIAQAREIAVRAAAGVAAEPDRFDADWRFLHQRLVAPAPERSEREPDEFDELVIVVAGSTGGLQAHLHRLLLLVCLAPLAAWLGAAAAGHWFCRRALQPVWDMATQARAMTGAESQARLPVAATGDELTDLALAFNTVLDRQQRALEQQRRFAGDAAHELRTPLTVLLGHIDVCLRRPRTSAEYESTLGLLRGQTAELQNIVESLLFLARADNDARPPDTATLELATWLPKYLARWDEHARRDDLRLEFAPTERAAVTVSPALLTRLLDNLVENALKYSPPESPIEITLTAQAGDAQVTVVDQGRGIAAEDQTAVFEPFFRSKSARDAGIAGAGLGLAIAARIARASGGQLRCTSEFNRGSRFTLELPLASNG